jgi:predicted Zn-dependent peptidase
MTTALGLRGPAALPNGIPFAALHRPGAEVTTVAVFILTGSRHEAVPGVAHLLEHVVMQAVPPGRRTRVVDEIEAWGGNANAMTTRDHIVLHARVPTSDAGAALTVLSAAATMTAFDDDLVAAERRVVLEELRLAAADPTDIVHDVFFATAYGDHPMGRPVGGTVSDATRLRRADLTEWSRHHIRSSRLGVVVSGGMTADEVAAALDGGDLAALDGLADDEPAESTPVVTAGRRHLPLVSDTAAVILGGQGFALADPALSAAYIVVELLAGGNASVLNEEIRSRRGLSYDVIGGASGYRDTGSWRISISTAPEHRDLVVDLSTDLVTEAVQRGWSEAAVAIARRRVAGLLRLEVESSLDETLLYGDFCYVGGSPDWSLPDHLARLSAISADQVNRVARIMTDQLVIATAGGDD